MSFLSCFEAGLQKKFLKNFRQQTKGYVVIAVSPHCLPFLVIHWVLLFTALFIKMLKYAQWLICFIFSIPKNVWFPNSNRFFFMLLPLNSKSDTGFLLPCHVYAKLAVKCSQTYKANRVNQLFNTSIKCLKLITFHFPHRRFGCVFQNRLFKS